MQIIETPSHKYTRDYRWRVTSHGYQYVGWGPTKNTALWNWFKDLFHEWI